MNWIDFFTVLIQTISAVNFAYIVAHFPDTISKMLFDKKALLDKGFSTCAIETASDIESLKSMDPIETKDGKTNQAILEDLLSNYSSFKATWEKQRSDTDTFIENTRDVKGFRSLFLFVSLYCFIILFNIAMIKTRNNDYWLFFNFVINLSYAISLIFYSIVLWKNKWNNYEKVDCYKKAVTWFLWILTGSFVLLILDIIANNLGWTLPIYKPGANILISLSIIIPFYPCILSFLYISSRQRTIKRMIGKDTKPLLDQQKKLREKKLELDKIYESFIPKISTPPVQN